MAIRIQRQVGGNLTELLSTVAATLRERDYLRRQVQTLSAEGRLSGWILGALPVGMFIYMLLVRREYVSRLWTEAMGLAMLGGAVVLLRSEEHTSELQSLMRISYDVFCLKNKTMKE